jgi:hypothetical protein
MQRPTAMLRKQSCSNLYTRFTKIKNRGKKFVNLSGNVMKNITKNKKTAPEQGRQMAACLPGTVFFHKC